MSRRPGVSPAFLVLDDDPACGPCLCSKCIAARPERAAAKAKHYGLRSAVESAERAPDSSFKPGAS